MFRSLPLLAALALTACVSGQEPDPIERARSELPVAARLGPTVLTFVYGAGTTCDARAPVGLPAGQGWQAAIGGCPGVAAVEVVLSQAAPEAVILRIADVSGPLTLTDLPPVALAEVWVAHPDGYWAHFTARP